MICNSTKALVIHHARNDPYSLLLNNDHVFFNLWKDWYKLSQYTNCLKLLPAIKRSNQHFNTALTMTDYHHIQKSESWFDATSTHCHKYYNHFQMIIWFSLAMLLIMNCICAQAIHLNNIITATCSGIWQPISSNL